MPAPVTVNDLSPISGSVQTSRISYGVEPDGKNYGQNYAGKNWYADIPNDGTYYTIVSDNYTANYYTSRSEAGGGYVEGGIPAVDEFSAPVFWTTTGTGSLDIINTVNGLPDRIGEVPFISGSHALEWLASSSNYFAIGPDFYRDIDADNMSFFLHGGQIISYPTTGSKWYDLSGVGTINMNLYNNPTYNNNGWIIFDGSDDYGEADAVITPSTGAFSVEFLYRIDSSGGRGGLFERNDATPYNGWSLGQGGAGIWSFTVADNLTNDSVQADWSYPTLGTWYHDIGTYNGSNNVKAYRNGVAVDSTTGTAQGNLDVSGSREPLRILKRDAGSSVISGSVAAVRIYPKELTANEVAQNYYGGPIVTGSNLIYAVDAGNLVSYPKSGTSVYDLTQGFSSMTLQNGVAFESQYGGYWDYDGTNDYSRITLNGFNPDDGVTMEMWTKRSSVPPAWRTYMNLKNATNVPFLEFRTSGANMLTQALYYDGTNFATSNVNLNVGEFYHLALTMENSGLLKYYVNGKFIGSTNANPMSIGPDPILSIGIAYDNTRNTDIGVASVRIYKDILTADQIAQNYNATN